MRTALIVGLFSGLVFATPQPLHAQSNEQAVEAAKREVQEWLALYDAGRYDSTWAEASAFFKSKVSEEKWIARVQQGRKQYPVLDSLRSRSLVAARYTTSLPRSPDGEYVVVQYKTAYADEPWVETVTLKKDPDGWRVAGYFVKPAGQQ